MKIIEKVLEEKPHMEKKELLKVCCPSEFGYKDSETCNAFVIEELNCKKCWNRELEEPRNEKELSKAF